MQTKLNRILLTSIAAAVLAASVRGQNSVSPEVESLRIEMQKLKQDYEQRLQSLEEKLHRLESAQSTSSARSNAPSVPETNTLATVAERGKAFANLQFSRDTETREWALSQDQNQPLKERAQKLLNEYLDIGGYFRAGYGRDDQGGPQVPFQAPGAFAKYRLGNETENYGELVFAKNWYVPDLFSLDSSVRPDGTPTGPIARVQVRLGLYDPYSNYGSSSSFKISAPEAWAEVGNVFASQPALKFWAGNRFYRRQDIHIDDFFFYNMSGGGGGFEDLELPFGKVALAWIGNGAQSGVYSSDIAAQPDPNNLAGFSKQSIDLSLYDVPVPLGKGEFALVFAAENSGKDALGQQAPNSSGLAFTFLHTHDHFLSQDGQNKFSVQAGTAAAKTFTSGYETTSLTNGTFIIPDAPGSWRVRVTESFVAQPWEHFSIGPALVYQYTDYNNQQGSRNWFSAGVRPIYHFNKYFSLAFEGGVDYVENTGSDPSGALYKLTLAPQVSLGDHFLSRPVIRAYLTYAGWSENFKGLVGGNDYVDQTKGWAWGLQMEAWW